SRRHTRCPRDWTSDVCSSDLHGRTLATLTATGQPKYQACFEPLPAGFRWLPYGDLNAVKQAIGPATAAVLVEPIQGEGGVRPARSEERRVGKEWRSQWAPYAY